MDAYKSSDNLEKKKGSDHKKGHQVISSSMAHPVPDVDQHASDNAFNQNNNMNYQYQGTDILTIGNMLLRDVKGVKFAGALGSGHDQLNTVALLEPLLGDLQEGERIVGAYNIGTNHWIAFAIIRNDNEGIEVAYNDSLGHKREGFEKEMKEILGDDVEFHEYLEKTQKESPAIACGLFALKNIEVLARAEDIENAVGFYSPTGNYVAGIKVLRKEYAVIYANEVHAETVAALELRAIRVATIELRSSESDKLQELIGKDVKCDIECEVRTEEDPKEYGYHIIFNTEKLEEVEKALYEFIDDQVEIEAVELPNGKTRIKVIPENIDDQDILELIEENNGKQHVFQKPSAEVIKKEWTQALNIGGNIIDTTLKEKILKVTGVEIEDKPQMLAEGLKYSLHGNLYQWSLLTWVALQADSEKQFRLITEAEGFEKFDDLVLNYDDKVIFLQAKHSSKKSGEDDYNKSDFTSNNYKGEASLAKYFDSWYRLEKGTHKKQESYYVFYTNRDVEEQDSFLEDCVIDIPELDLGRKTLRFKKGDSREEFITAIRASSKEVATHDGGLDFKIEDNDYQEASTYIAGKFKDFAKKNKNGKKEFKIDGTAKISKKARAVIKLAQEDDEVLAKVIKGAAKASKDAAKEVIKDNEGFKNWLRAKEKDAFKINVDIKNPKEILSDVLGDEINAFLDQFILKVNQLNFGEMLGKIQEETAVKTSIASSEFCANIGQKVLEWFADPKVYDLSSEKVRDIIESAKGDALRFYLLADSVEVSVLEGSALPEIKGFLEKDGGGIVRVESSPGLELRIAQTIKEQKMHVDQYAFFRGTSNYLEYAPTILNGDQMQVAVFDYSGAGDNIPFEMDELTEILESAKKNEKKIIILVRKGDTRFDQYGEEMQVENELSNELVDKVIEQNSDQIVNIAGKDYTLSALTNDKGAGVYQAMKRADFLYDILDQHKQKPKELELGLPYGVYIENELVQGEAVYQWPAILLSAEASLFVIKGQDLGRIKKILGHDSFKDRVVRGEEKANENTKYRLIEDREELEKYRKEEHVKHICIGDDLSEDEKFAYQNSYIVFDVNEQEVSVQESDNVELPVANSYRFTEENTVERSDIENENFCIVSANAGRGKSSFCLYEREKWVKESMIDKYSWVIRLNLAHLEFQGSKATIGELFNKKMSGVDWPDWQLAAVMHDIAISGKVKIFLDGFDEIKDVTVIQKLGVWMSTLPKETQLVLATRPYAAHNVPMPHNRNLDLFLTLNEYSDDEKDKYVKEYITAVFDGKDNDNIEKVIGKYQKLIKDSPENIRSTLGIPLESYLFCDGFETEMVADYKVLQAGGGDPDFSRRFTWCN